ncbi:peptide deformylase [Parvibaculum lavamentivorans DS-1]|uniref:Peptide deformylase n=1 Tax=Parvibaculum lavamentivorans (strain DS-1 / DSM 13023 / NCIMB 13966) TaxID=402881 RepID=A7HUU9_PARL1|nr:peptide deformylase [Parvibaculum lavamentivorans]ABS63682.1 peptide deformylase [Parvibaculum lavamentivorans DS-1]
MAIRKIARMGHPVLRGIARPVPDPTAPEVKALVRDMIETMIDANGAGLAAPQVYEPWRIVVFQAPESRLPEGVDETEAFDHTAPLTVLINPEVEILTEEMEKGWEGCLSVPGLRGSVPRHTELRYRGYGLNGELIERRARGFHARVIQHECDHLDGILYPQRMDDLAELIFESEARAWLAARAEKAEAEEGGVGEGETTEEQEKAHA